MRRLGKKYRIALLFASGVPIAVVSAAEAQTVTPDVTQSTPADGDIVVTATRVERQGYEAPTPTTVIGSSQIEAKAAANLADVVNDVPALSASTRPQTVNALPSLGNAGANLLNLRNLGANRTLVLLDGARPIPSNATLNVDINLLPAELVKRVDVVTGGASASWGSDAVSGVVNFVLDKKYTGLKLYMQGGMTEHGDGENFQAGATIGRSLFGDRGHVLLSARYNQNGAVAGPILSGRDWYRGYKAIANPNGSGKLVVLPNVGLSGGTDGGLITAGPLRGTQFVGPNGTPIPFDFGFVSGQESVNGTAEDSGGYVQLQPEQRQGSAFGRLSYELSDNVEVYLQGQYGRSMTSALSTPSNRLNNLVMQSDNAYLPESVRDALLAEGETSFVMGKVNRDLGYIEYKNDIELWNGMIGLSGRAASNWAWNAYYQQGETRLATRPHNLVNNARYAQAIDAVVDPSTGTIVCRSTLADPGNGCVPMNIFGNGTISNAALAYATGTGSQDVTVKQKNAVFNVSGTPFSTWAGPVSLAAGLEYRKLGYAIDTDLISQHGGWSTNLGTPATGGFNVKEGFIETVVPVLKDSPLGHSLDLNGAIRLTDYSISGSVATWKLGLTYQITDRLRVRAVRSRDIRAPNLQDLFATGISGINVLTDPETNSSYQIQQVTSGNRGLSPETAKTLSAGVVFEPRQIPGLSVSVDWYSIKIANAIVTPPAQSIIDQCFAGNAQACTGVIRGGAGNTITQINILPLNIQSEKSSGVDIAVNYSIPLSGNSGRITLGGLATYTASHTVDLLGSSVQFAGTNGDTFFADPRWRASATQIYTTGGLTIGLTERFIGAGDITKRAVIENGRVPAVIYTDMNVSYKMRSGLQVFAAVDNLFDKDPPASPNVSFVPHLNLGVNNYIYDTLGRRARVGVRFEM